MIFVKASPTIAQNAAVIQNRGSLVFVEGVSIQLLARANSVALPYVKTTDPVLGSGSHGGIAPAVQTSGRTRHVVWVVLNA